MVTGDKTDDYFVENTGENERTVHTGSAKIYLRRKDPYGFWFVSFERGEIPAYLDQAFTSIDRAYEALENYMNTNKHRAKIADRERIATAKRKFDEKVVAQGNAV